MANHFWIYATKRQDEFYSIRKVILLLDKEFPQFQFYLGVNPVGKKLANYFIIVRTNKLDFLFNMELWNNFFTGESGSKDKMDLIESLDKKDENLADKVLTDLEDKGELLCIEVRRTSYHEEINLITRWMRQYFQAIVMDEGIYPEVIFPIPESESYLPPIKKSFIKKFGDWLSK